VKPWTRIPVALDTVPGGRRCRLGWHRVRWTLRSAIGRPHEYVPACTRCRGVACWWLRDRRR